ncbi:hypothetical protein HZS_2217 [Henneguya salminicola]|nr:hypothetical protein HZS_2217 [Henneguya salminicola]
MRNADYSPTRFHSLYDAINSLLTAKSRENFETTFGVLSLTGFELLCSFTSDTSKVLQRVHTAPIKGRMIDIIKGLKIAELVLEQREHLHSSKRIVALVGSPFLAELDPLVELACRFLENKVFVDIILFGEESGENVGNLQNFIDILNDTSEPGSHLLIVPPGDSVTRLLRTSEITPESQRGKTGASDLDFDAEMDPDLAEAIRLSMQDKDANQPTTNAMDIDPVFQDMSLDNFEEIDVEKMTEQQQIEWAMRLSLQDTQPKEKKEVLIKFLYFLRTNLKMTQKKRTKTQKSDKSYFNSFLHNLKYI